MRLKPGKRSLCRAVGPGAAAVLLLLGGSNSAPAQTTTVVTVESAPAGPRLDVYGFARMDAGYDFKQNDPDWFDVMRPSKLPAFKDQFGDDGNYYASARQSLLGFKGYLPTALGEVKTIFEFDLVGTGGDAGQTTFHLRHAWGEVGHFGAGQTWSPFMDEDVGPNTIDYWGPNGMAAFRNLQIRWMPMNDDMQVWVALERPGATADGGVFQQRIDLQGVKGHFPAPDVSFRFRKTGDWGHLQVSGLFRYIAWSDTVPDQVDLSGNRSGWGLNLSTNVKTGTRGTVKAAVVYGEGIENYMNDAPVDIGAEPNRGNPLRPISGKALPVFGVLAFYDLRWNDRFSSSFGYSRIDIDNSSGQADDAFKNGQYAIANVQYSPVKNVVTGLELQWGRRENFRDGFAVDDYRIQFASKFSFDFHLGGS
jgi:hypothetical protein